MRRPEFIARQAGRPSGLLGYLLARVMAVETASDNRRAIEFLAPCPGDHVLEIGFGHGRTIGEIAALVPSGVVAGVEVSERMLQMANRFNRRLVERGRVELKVADGIAIPYEDDRFDRVMSVHTIYFWPKPDDILREVGRVAKRGARLVLGFRTSEDESVVRSFPRSVYRFYRTDEVEHLLEHTGFREIQFMRSTSDARETIFAVAERTAR